MWRRTRESEGFEVEAEVGVEERKRVIVEQAITTCNKKVKIICFFLNFKSQLNLVPV